MKFRRGGNRLRRVRRIAPRLREAVVALMAFMKSRATELFTISLTLAAVRRDFTSDGMSGLMRSVIVLMRTCCDEQPSALPQLVDLRRVSQQCSDQAADNRASRTQCHSDQGTRAGSDKGLLIAFRGPFFTRQQGAGASLRGAATAAAQRPLAAVAGNAGGIKIVAVVRAAVGARDGILDFPASTGSNAAIVGEGELLAA